MKTGKRILCVAFALVLALSCVVISGCNTKSEVKGIGTNGTQSSAASNASKADNASEAPATLPSTGYKKPYTGSSRTDTL